HLCGETGANDPSGNCPASVQPRFDIIQVQGGPNPVPPPPNNGTGLEAHNLWDLEVSLDVEWAHATAPLANIMLVTSPTAETLGVQGFQQFMNAEQFVIDHHMADVISQSFASGEGAFHSGLAALKQLRTTYVSAKANHVTILSSSGDGGSLNSMKEPVKNPALIPYASVEWPASDPLVTAVGGTYLASSRAGVVVSMTEPNFPRQSTGGLVCPAGQTCSAGWWVVGGTSAGSPQWAGLIAMADEMAGRDLGYLNAALYNLAANPSTYAADFYDDNTNSNAQSAPGSGTSGNCCPSSRGWD